MSYIRVKVTGGLGNQLFKTLVGISFAKEFKSGLVLDTSWYNKKRKKSDPVNPRKFEIDAFPELKKEFEIHARVNPSVLDDRIGQLLRRVDDKISAKFNYITDSNYSGIRLGKKHYVLDGNFENWKLLPSDQDLRRLLRFPTKKSLWFYEMQQIITGSRFIAIHIRRGDYLNLPQIYNILTQDYYLKGIEAARKVVGNLPIVLFSDDSKGALEWISNKFPIDFIVPNSSDESPIEILELMSNGTAIVCAHSTFSWWSAKIGTITKTANFVVIPERFFSHNNQINHNLNVPNWITINPE